MRRAEQHKSGNQVEKEAAVAQTRTCGPTMAANLTVLQLLILLCSAACLATDPGSYRLPTHLVPESYKLSLVPFLTPGNFTSKGQVDITVLCMEDAKNFTLHAKNISVLSAEVVGGPSVVDPATDVTRDFIVGHLDAPLRKGSRYVIRIRFVSKILDAKEERGIFKKAHGLFYTQPGQRYKREGKYLAFTQFETTFAREAFPCFDEPALKATFEISLGRTRDMSSVSNMPIRRKGAPMKGTDEYVWDHFEKTKVVMSTYLVAFAVTDYERNIAPADEQNVELGIIVDKSVVSRTDCSKKAGRRLMKHYEDLFGVGYPLPKMDFIEDSSKGGAMENWGLVTYREELLTCTYNDELKSDRASIVIAHELAHQWFGNLVSPKWWSQVWLNEGFATYYGVLDGVHYYTNDWDKANAYLLRQIHEAMAHDGSGTSIGLSADIPDTAAIHSLFDDHSSITYQKGAAIVRMMEHFLTKETLTRGLRSYLKAMACKSATKDDLWNHLDAQAKKDGTLDHGLDVKTIMDSWTVQPGYPVITVERDYKGRTATVTQKRFYNWKFLEETSEKWWVPITWTVPNGDFNKTHNVQWLKPDQDKLIIKGLPEYNVPIVVNVQAVGYYRVNYDRQNWLMLQEELEASCGSIHLLNRIQMEKDAVALNEADILDDGTASAIADAVNKCNSVSDEEFRHGMGHGATHGRLFHKWGVGN